MAARLPSVHGDRDAWGDVLNQYLVVGHRTDGTHGMARVVTEYGADPTGGADSATAIQAAIAASQPGDAIVFPGGTYVIEQSVLIKANRAYIAQGSATLLQKANTELDAMVSVDPGEAYPRRGILWFGIELNGNAVDPTTGNQTNNTIYTAGSNYTKNRGMVLDSVQFSNFIGLQIRDCGNDGLVVTGSSTNRFEQQGSTNHFVSPYFYGNGGRNVVFGPMADDNHIYDGDIGDSNFAGVTFLGGSSSLRNCTVWGSRQSHGVIVGAPSNQIIGCQIEGNAQHGIAVLTRYASWIKITGCKVYDNSYQTPGGFDGIYVNGEPGYVNTPGTDAAGTLPATAATVEFYPRADYNYGGPNAISFTVADGTTTQTVSLGSTYGHLANVVSAVDAALDGSYVVGASGGYVTITSATAGAKTLTIGGTDAAAITGAAGVPCRYIDISDNFIYAGIGDFYLNESGEVDPTAGGGWYDANGVWQAGKGWGSHRHGITLDTLHQYVTVNNNNAMFNAAGAGAIDPGGPVPGVELQHGGPDSTLLPVFGLAAGDTYNGVYWATGDAEETAWATASPRAVPAGSPWWRNDAGQFKLHTGPSRDRIERVLTSKYDVEGGTFTGNGAASQNVSIPNTRFDTAYTVVLSPTWDTTWWVDGKTGTQFTVHYGTPGTGAVDYTLVRQSG